MRILYFKRALLFMLLFAVGWAHAQNIQSNNSRGSLGALNGAFSVSENTRVCFSKGNLQYNASTNTWRFAEHQWDFVGGTEIDSKTTYGNVYEDGVQCDNNLRSSTYDGWIDLFGWGTSGYEHGAVCYQPWSVETAFSYGATDAKYYAYGNKDYDLNGQTGNADWGYNAISNGGEEENLWRTLTKDEWVYLLNTRSTPSGIRFAHAVVNGVVGLIVLPDDWDSSIFTLNDVNNGTKDANPEENVIDLTQWEVLEENGAVFLPKNGLMWLDQYGYAEFNYWSSTHADDNNAYNFCYNDFIFQVDATYFRHVGMGVRLVTTAYQVRAAINPAGYGTVEGAGAYALGETCTITAIPNEGCAFVCWTIDGEVVSRRPSETFEVDQDYTLVANFEAVHSISASVNPNSGGAIAGLYDFEDGKQGWTALDYDGDGHNWIESYLYSYSDQYDYLSGNVCMMSASYDDENDEMLTPDNWLVSPLVELGGSVSLWACGLEPSYSEEHFAIYVSTSGTDMDNFSKVTDEFVAGEEMVQYVADLSEFSGMGYIAIRHFNCTDMYYLLVDDIAIVTPSLSMIHLEGEPCSLFALPNGGYDFLNWTENGAVVSTDAEYSFDVSGDGSFVANFIENNNTYDITVTASPETSGVVTGGGSYLHNAVCTLTATPAEGYVFVGWTENGETVSTDAEYRFMATQERNLVAEFVPLYTVNISANPSGGGTVFFEDADLCEITLGTVETMSNSNVPVHGNLTSFYLKCEMAYPANELSDMVGKDIDGITYYAWHSNVSWGNASFRVFLTEVESDRINAFVGEGTVVYEGPLNVDDNGEMLVNFSTPYHYNGGNLLVGVYNTVKGTGMDVPWHGEVREGVSVCGYSYSSLDAITPTQQNFLPKTTFAYESGLSEKTYPSGETCTLLARPNEGFEFDSWRENGEVVSESPSYSFTVLSDRTLEAFFEGRGSYLLSLNTVPEEGGKLLTNLYYEIETPFATNERIEEQDISVVAAANKGWRFAYWTSNGEVIPNNNVCAFHLSEDTELVAYFEPCEVASEPDLDLLSGRFSISGCTTVGFAKGNVIAQIQIDTINDLPVATSASWQFAETQYYRQEYDADAIAENGIGDLLSEGMDLVWDVYRSIGLVDVGCWHLLSGSEWDYLLNGRPYEVRYAFATVNGVAGLLVLPDDWAAVTYELNSANEPAAYETNEITLADWQNILEPAGALFLPANGMLMCPPTAQGQCQYQFESNGTPVGGYGNMSFHPTEGIVDVSSYPIMGYAWAASGAFYSMRLAQVVAQATSTVVVSVADNQSDYGTVSGGDSFACGAECTIVATPNEGFVFQYWLEDGEVASVEAEYTFEVAGDRALVAEFAEENAVCNIQFELFSDERYSGMFGWGGEALHLRFNDGTPDISLTIPAPEVDWNAVVVAIMAGAGFDLSSYGFPQSSIYTIPINRGASVTLSWIAPSMGEEMVLNFSNTFSVRNESGEPIIENAGQNDMPFTFQCNCEDVGVFVDPEAGGSVVTDDALLIGESVTVTAVANEHYAFVNWTFNGVEVGTSPTYSFVVSEAGALVAHFELLNDIAISVSASPEEGGTVTGDGMYGYGSICTVTAVPNDTYSFMYWTENGNVVSSNASYSFMVNNDRNLVAQFMPPLTITAIPNLSLGGVITGAGEYSYGSVCTLTASPSEGYLFLNWSINGEVVDVHANYSFTVTEDKEIEAVFMVLNGYLVGEGEATSNEIPINSSYHYRNSLTQQIYMPEELGGSRRISRVSFYNAGDPDTRTLDIYIAHTNSETFDNSTIIVDEDDRVFSGEVTFNKGYWTTVPLSRSFNYNGTSNLLLVVYDHTGSRLASTDFRVFDAQGNQSFSVGGDYSPLVGNSFFGGGYSTLPVKNQIILNQSKYYIETSYCFETGSVSGSGSFNAGEICTLTAVPREGFSFLYWSENGEQVSTDSNYSFLVASDRYLTAHFTPSHITAIADPEEGGTVSGAGEYDCNSTCTLTALPDEGYTFMNWTCGGNVVSTESTYSFTVGGNGEYVAHFALPFDVSVTINPSEGGTVFGEGEYDYGTTCTLTAVPNEGYMFLNWIDELGRVGNEATYSITVTADTHLTVNFEKLPNGMYVGAGGTVAIDGLPSCSYRSYSISQQIYTQSELGNDREIYNLSFYNTGGATTRNYDIFMVHTELDSIDMTVLDSDNTGWIGLSPDDLVFSGDVTMESGDWSTINLNTPFNYNGVSNLAIIVNDKTGSATTSIYSDRMMCRVYKGDGLQAIFQSYGSTMYDPYNIPQGFSYYPNRYKNQILLNRFCTITATPEPETCGTVTGMGEFAYGTSCSLSAIPSGGYYFKYWTEDDSIVSFDRNYEFTVKNDRTLVAHFEEICKETPAVYVSAKEFTEATIAWDSENDLFDLRYRLGENDWTLITNLSTTSYTLTGLEEMGDYDVEVRSSCGDGVGYSEWGLCSFNNEHYTINAVAHPSEAGSITGAGTYWAGHYVRLRAIPIGDYVFSAWTENGDTVSTESSYRFYVTGDRELVAEFVPYAPTYYIAGTAEPSEGGTVTGTGYYLEGASCTLTALPNEGYGFLYWTEDGEVVSDDATFTFTVTEDRSLVAHFSPNIQAYSLSPGWNWISTYIEQEGPEGLAMLEEGLNPNGVMIKSQCDGFDFCDANLWIGTLEAIDNEKMYMVHTSAQSEVTLTGAPAIATAHPITLNPNWNWVGYPLPYTVDLNYALASLNASNDDVIKSMSGFSYFDEKYGWCGVLDQLIPGEGYMYRSHNTQPIELTYPFDINRSSKSNVTPENYHWKAAVHAYPNNMNLIAVVELDGEELRQEHYELAAFTGDECRGSARLAYVEPMRRYVAFLTMAGEETVDINLVLCDAETGKAYWNTTDRLGFEADAVVGSLRTPYVARFGSASGMDDMVAQAILLYPNPVSKGEVFQLELPAENDGARVSLVNALGEVVSVADLNAKPATMCAPTSPGVYVVRIETRSHGTYCKKLIVK
jgi:hypothetical protein